VPFTTSCPERKGCRSPLVGARGVILKRGMSSEAIRSLSTPPPHALQRRTMFMTMSAIPCEIVCVGTWNCLGCSGCAGLKTKPYGLSRRLCCVEMGVHCTCLSASQHDIGGTTEFRTYNVSGHTEHEELSSQHQHQETAPWGAHATLNVLSAVNVRSQRICSIRSPVFCAFQFDTAN
jgi:hypothetical protein